MKPHRNPFHVSPCGVCLLAVTGALAVQCSHLQGTSRGSRAETAPRKILGLDTVIAFYSAPAEIKSQTFVRGDNWKDWQARGGVVSKGITHQKFLSKNVGEASDVLVNMDFVDNPHPIVNIDEFGWDYDGGIDRHSAAILNAVHEKRPELKIAVWQMRGPVAPQLAKVYRDTVDLVMLETYYTLDDAWMIAFALQTARLNGILDRSVIGLGLGSEAPRLGGWEWTRTAQELEQQIRLIRYVAPESPGVAFFGSFLEGDRAMRMTRQELDYICGRFRQFPTDGTGLEPALLELGKTFTRRYRKPAVFASSNYVLPFFHSGHDGAAWGQVHEPQVARTLLMNLGETDARGVEVRLLHAKESVWAEGSVDIPARTVVVAELPMSKGFLGWGGTGTLEIDAPGCEVFFFLNSRYHGN